MTPEDRPLRLRDLVETETYRVEPGNLPKSLIKIAKFGPRGLPGLVADNMTDLGLLAEDFAGIRSARDGLGAPNHGFYDTDPVPQPSGYSVSNYSTSRTLDASTATLAQTLDFLCTLVDDLKSIGLLG